MNDLKRRLKAGETVVGAWLSSDNLDNAEAMATCGFDWLGIDLEHSATDLGKAPAVILATERHGVSCLVRLPSADPFLARRLLDVGAVGVLVPVVQDVDDFAGFARHLLYPPAGWRGVGLSRCNRWGDTFDGYLSEFQPVIVPMIETRKGVDAADSLAKLDFVDGLFLGPYDLSANLGRPGHFDHPHFVAARAAVRDACQRNGKAGGIHQVAPDREQLQARRDEGFRLIAFGTDLLAIRHAFRFLREEAN